MKVMILQKKQFSHKPKNLNAKTPKGKVYFDVKYLGDDKIYKDISYATLRDNEVLHTYLEEKHLKSLVPPKYKWGRQGPPVPSTTTI